MAVEGGTSHPRRRRSKWVLIAAIVIAVGLLLSVLLFVPLESSAFNDSATASQNCQLVVPCPESSGEFNVGDGRYATLSGSWVSNSTAGSVLVTINDSPSSKPCSLCADGLYSSFGATLGTFSVSGTGPFHFSVLPLENGNSTVTFTGTITTTVI